MHSALTVSEPNFSLKTDGNPDVIGICWLLPGASTPALQLWKAAVKMLLAYIHVCMVCAKSQGHIHLEQHDSEHTEYLLS